jgi:hypothetical protein
VESKGGAAAPTPFCPKHPNGTDQACRACGNARRAFETAQQTKRDQASGAQTLADQGLCKHAVPADGCWQCAEAGAA